jgi:RNA polymerase sigma-70 factor (ECF subfamily)
MTAVDFEAHRPALTGHCYRMLGSAFDADDAVQETMIRAWRGLDQFDGRASLKTWLYRIATNVCLDELKERGRRARPIEEGSPSSGAPPIEALTQRPGAYWIEPILDARVLPKEADPSELAMLRQSIRLAFVAALQNLTPKQRAVHLLMEVLECSAAEVAEFLETSVASVNSALQRARATIAQRNYQEPAELSEAQRGMLKRYVTAFETYDVEGLTALMRQDVTFCASILALVARPGGCSDVDARLGVWMPRIAPGFNGCLRLAGVCSIPARSSGRAQGVGPNRSRTGE